MSIQHVGLASVKPILETARTIAVLGVSASPEKPAHFVPLYAAQHQYRVIPVNPLLTGQTLFGETVRSSLAEIKEPVDIVDIFRRAEILPDHLEDILAMTPRPKLVWLQLGIKNDVFAQKLLEAGIEIVQDRCLLADHRSLGL